MSFRNSDSQSRSSFGDDGVFVNMALANPGSGYVRNEAYMRDLAGLMTLDPEALRKDPSAFMERYSITPPELVSIDHAKARASNYSETIFANWHTLQNILDRHEETIRSRWAKKSVKNRRQLLQDVWPEIPKEHRGEWKALMAAAQTRGLDGPIKPPEAKYRNAFLVPHLNLEDLSGPRSLMVLLNARTRAAPGVFSLSDYQSAYLGVQTRAINQILIQDHRDFRMWISGKPSSATYGAIQAMTGISDEYTSTEFVDPTVGMVILEVQDRIMSFLVKCAEAILNGIPKDELLSDAYPVRVPLPALDLQNEAETVTIPSLSEEGPYRVPHAMDFDALLSLIEAKRSECEDTMWSLREDPGYFAEMAMSRAEHRQESVLDLEGKEHPFKGTQVFWDRILTNLAAEAYSYLMSWTVVKDFVRSIKVLHTKYADDLSPDKPLPKELASELMAYKEFINLMQSTPLLQLNSAVPGSPELRNDWWRDVTYPDPNVCSVHTKKPVLYDYLLMLFTILADDQRREVIGLQNIMDEIERLIRHDPAQKARISPMVAQMFSDLALTGELERQLKMYQPRLFEPFYNKEKQYTRDASLRMLQQTSRMMDIAQHMDEMRIGDEGNPKNNRFEYPADQPRSKETIEKMRLAEIKLDKFWEKVDRLVLTRARKPWRSGMMIQALNPGVTTSVVRTLQRTAPWSDVRKQPKEPKPSVVDQQFELQLRTQRTVNDENKPVAKSRSKKKTRGIKKVDSMAANEVDFSDEESQDQVFVVNKRIYKVFKALFYSPESPDRPGEIAWQDFLAAMAATGFVFEKLYGSVWQFTPTKLDVERAINFHEPHPDKKIPHRMARRYGGRLYRAYGWNAQTFRLE